MKMVMLMYLEEDEGCVERLVDRAGVTVFSRLSVEGRGPGSPGWRGTVPAYASRITMAVVDDDRAADLLEAVRTDAACEDARHPVRAVQLDVEASAACRTPEGSDEP